MASKSANTTGPRDVDRYIENVGDSAMKQALTRLRGQIREVLPTAVEKISYQIPMFYYQDRGLVSFAAFKAHCAFGFWKGSLLFPDGAKKGEAMGQMGRIASLEDLPPQRELLRLVKAARKLDEEGAAPPRKKAAPAKPAAVPGDLAAALRRNAKARATFEGFPPGRRNEYVAWVVEAKREETRKSRVTRSVEWLAEGKARNWKYEKR